MAEFFWYGIQTDMSELTITGADGGTGDIIGFYGTNYDDAIAVGAWNESTHIESGGSDKCVATHFNNTQYTSAGNISINGTGTVALVSGTIPVSGACPLHLRFNHGSSVTLTSVSFWADDGAVSTNPPTNVSFKCGKYGDEAWTDAEGSASALDLENHPSTNQNHHYFIFCSASPDAVGDLTGFRLQLELTYQ